ncbi:MAG: rhomboid family intramembrane serine protease [Bacteroidales bacterium]|jgi:membrane associated rhomboid family serine protease|nr:rhomboid family intramembrane serine protease [Bacteroidales bacterium]
MYYGQNPFSSQRRPAFGENLRNFITSQSTLNRLIVINVSVHLAIWILEGLFTLFGFLMQADYAEVILPKMLKMLECPASFSQWLRQPWSLVTSLFLHANLWHLAMNMLMLYVVGRIFIQFLDNRKLLITYFAGGIVGNLIYMTAYNVFPVFAAVLPLSYALGASGSIMAIMAAITAYRPNYELNLILIGRIKLYWIMLIFIVIDLFGIEQGNAGGHIAHLGGALYGFLSQFYYRGYHSGSRRKVNFKNKKKREKQKTSAPHDARWRPMTDEEYNAQKNQEQQKIDEILDKISKNGYDALSKNEKDFLFNYSKK